jgi:hypothetical protein
VSVPRGPVVESLAADGALLPLLRVAHAGGRYLLHVVVQLKLLKEKQCLFKIDKYKQQIIIKLLLDVYKH